MTHRVSLDRRRFLRTAAVAGAGFGLGVTWPLAGSPRQQASSESPAEVPPAKLGAWIEISPDNTLTIMISKCEMGQGISTAAAMLVAEELGAEWSRVRTEWAPLDPVYSPQRTAASDSVRTLWEPLRQAGAAAREMLIAAAAATWGVAREDCRSENSHILHRGGERRLTHGELAELAATFPIPEAVPLKSPDELQVIGRSVPRVDVPAKVDGSAVYGWDVRLPEMLVATIERCPVIGGSLGSYDAEKTLAVDGVRAVVPVRPYFRKAPSEPEPTGVAVVADDTWSAHLGRKALEIEWDEGPKPELSSDEIRRRFREGAEQAQARTTVERGDLAAGRARTDRRIEAVYETPYLAHATMSPMCCTAHVREDGCDLWVPTQAPEWTAQAAAKITGLALDSIRVHKTYLGGGFGRRLRVDFAAEAVRVSQAVKRPVQVVWTREDDIRHGTNRPATYHVLSAGLEASGLPAYWRHRVVGSAGWHLLVKGLDAVPYAVPNKLVDVVLKSDEPYKPLVPTGAWRGLGHSQNGFVVEGFVDELAAAAGQDPYEYRRRLLADAPRHRAVLDLAAAKAGWRNPPPPGLHRGIAIHDTENGIVAEVAEASVEDRGEVRVRRVVCAVDCGLVVHPDTVEAQIEGAVIFGLTATLYGEITIEGGRVQQSNFHDYPILRMDQVPEIEVHVVAPAEGIAGVGEAGLPPIAPAVAGAVFAATGRRIRTLPIRLGADS